jgi:hypothetical protein
MKTPDEVAAIIDNAKRIGVQSVEIDGIKYDLMAKNIPVKTESANFVDLKAEDILRPMKEEITEEELKYWSTPYYDILQQEKELKAQHIKDEV